jgi:uncharacterized repeat protein (TIGR01451 family)
MKKFLTLLFTFYFSTLSAQWEQLQAPGVVGNVDLAKSNGQLFAMTQTSLLQRSASNGLTWEPTNNPVQLGGPFFVHYYAMDADDNLLAVLIIQETGITQVFKSVDYGAAWTLLPGSPQLFAQEAELFVHMGEVYLNVNNELYHFNSGSWNLIPTFSSIYNKSFTFKGNQIWMSTNQKMQYSANLGGAWQDVITPYNWAHSIASDGNGILAAAEDFIYYSNDNGLNWQQRPLASHTNMKVISHDGISYASEPGQLYRSNNSLLNPTPILSGLGTVRDIHEINGFWVAGTSYGIYRSPSDPADWQWISSGVSAIFSQFMATAGGVLFYTHNQTAFSTDEGDTWHVTNGRHKFFHFLHHNSTWYALKYNEIWQSSNLTDWTKQVTAVLDTGQVFWAYVGNTMVYSPNKYSSSGGNPIDISIDGGVNWSQGGTVPANTEELFVYNNKIYANTTTKLLKSDNFGGTWTEVGNTPGGYYFQTAPGKIYAINFQNMLISYNDGVDWISRPNPQQQNIDGLIAFDGKVVLLPFNSNSGTLYMTMNDGQNWQPIMAGFTAKPGSNLVSTGNILFNLSDNSIPWRRGNFSVSVSQYSGKVYRELGSNSQYDIGDPLLANTILHLTNTSQITTTNAGGTFNIFAETQNDILTAISPGKYCTFDPPNYAVNPTNTQLDFGLNCPAGITDLSVNLYSAPFRPGFDTDINLFVKNQGNDVADGTLTLTLEPNVALTVVNTIPAATQNNNVLTWQIAGLQSLDHLNFVVWVNTPANTPLGTMICNNAEVALSANDAYLPDNTVNMCPFVVGSFDPNDKQVNKTAYAPGTQPPLEYTVRFQNTGTYLASFVVIKDTLSPNLDPGTLRVLGASHPFTWTLRGNGIVEFRFDGINLPDMTSDEPGSHGFVQFSVEPRANQPLGLMTENTAFIYFDFNDPIITNTVTSTVTSTHEPAKTVRLVAQPNPANESLRLVWPDGQAPNNLMLYLHDASGRLIRTLHFDHQDMTIDVRTLKAGTYQVWGVDGERQYSAMFEVIH